MSIHDEAEKIRRKLDEENSTTVSVALFGQPGAGKSSLINKIVGQKVAEVGVETDKTVEAASYEAKGLRFVDLPGYGTKNFPKESYFQKFDIQKFDLFLCVTSGKLHQADTEFFQELARRGKVCIFVVNKHDELWEDGIAIEELEQRKINDITKHVGQPVKIVFTSCRKGTGLDALTLKFRTTSTERSESAGHGGPKHTALVFCKKKDQPARNMFPMPQRLPQRTGLTRFRGSMLQSIFQ